MIEKFALTQPLYIVKSIKYYKFKHNEDVIVLGHRSMFQLCLNSSNMSKIPGL